LAINYKRLIDCNGTAYKFVPTGEKDVFFAPPFGSYSLPEFGSGELGSVNEVGSWQKLLGSLLSGTFC
jgi:hypothetical protein